jgi:hypothetical protein
MADTPIEFVVTRKAVLSDKTIGVGIVPVSSFDPDKRSEYETFFSDKPRGGFLIGGVYRSRVGELKDGKIVSISVEGSTFVHAHEADFTEAKLAEQARVQKADLERFAKRLKKEPALSFEVANIAAAIKRLPRHLRYDAMTAVSAAISDKLWSI